LTLDSTAQPVWASIHTKHPAQGIKKAGKPAFLFDTAELSRRQR